MKWRILISTSGWLIFYLFTISSIKYHVFHFLFLRKLYRHQARINLANVMMHDASAKETVFNCTALHWSVNVTLFPFPILYYITHRIIHQFETLKRLTITFNINQLFWISAIVSIVYFFSQVIIRIPVWTLNY